MSAHTDPSGGAGPGIDGALVFVVEDDPALTASLMPPDYKARPEQTILFHVEAWDTNCPKHIPLRFDAETVAQELAKREARIDALEAEIGQLRSELATVSRAAGS